MSLVLGRESQHCSLKTINCEPRSILKEVIGTSNMTGLLNQCTYQYNVPNRIRCTPTREGCVYKKKEEFGVGSTHTTEHMKFKQ